MRAVIQRVMNASVSVGGEKISEIGRGLCVLIGIAREDTAQEMEYIAKKILSVRLFDGENGKTWAKSVVDKDFEVLCVSQFTLYSILKGNKPDYHEAMSPDISKSFYEEFIQQIKRGYKADKIKDGVFGEYMQVNIQNDGPVTISLESPVFSQQEKEKFLRKQKVAKEKQAKPKYGGKNKNIGSADSVATDHSTTSVVEKRSAGSIASGDSSAPVEANIETLTLTENKDTA